MRQNNLQASLFVRVLGRIPVMIRAIVAGFLVSSIGIAVWSAAFIFLPAVWAMLITIPALWLYWQIFSGRFAKGVVADRMKALFRATRLTPVVWRWGMVAAACFVLAVQSSFVVTFRLLPFPHRQFTADYKIVNAMPFWMAMAVIVMGSVVAGICEEVGFRGYTQAPLEKKYGPFVGIVVTSICFMLVHLSHSWVSPILPHIFFASVLLGLLAYRSGSLIPGIIAHSILDIFDYTFWWTDLAGGFTRRPIAETGVDGHFLLWTVVLGVALWGFFKAVAQLRAGKTAK